MTTIFSKFIVNMFLLFLIYNLEIIAQDQVVNLWQGNIPNAIDAINFKENNIILENGAIRIQKVTNPTLSIFFPSKEIENGSSIIICPGGGYSRLAFDHEGIKIAKLFTDLGFTAFILKYRLPNDTIMLNKSIGPLQDVQEAIRYVRRNAEKYNLSENKIGIIGFSAGGHLAATASTQFSYNVYTTDATSSRPDFSILIYPVISMKKEITHLGSRKNLLGDYPSDELVEWFSNEEQVSKSTPPTFLVHSQDDKSVSVENSINYFFALKKNNVQCELHIFEKGGHGYGMGKEIGTEEQWPVLCKSWLIQRGFLSTN